MLISFNYEYFSFQLSSSDVDLSIDSTLGNFNDAAPLFGADTKHHVSFIGITTHPTTPVASTRQMPPLAYPQPKQSSSSSSTFNSNGLTQSSTQSSVINNSSSRTYGNNNTIINNNNTTINNVNSYQQQKSSSSNFLLAPPPQSRANSNSIISNNNTSSITSANNNNNTFVRPLDSKPLINGRSGYTTTSQLNKHEVNMTFTQIYTKAIALYRCRCRRSMRLIVSFPSWKSI